MADLAWCHAVRTIADRLFPTGFDVSSHAPNTFLDLAVHVARTGRFEVASGTTEDAAFDSAETWYAFRAWHDWCHLQGGHGFDFKGECTTVRLQYATLVAIYGAKRASIWRPILHRQIIAYNFGDDAGCPAAFAKGG